MKLEQITIEGYRAHSKTTFSLEDDLTVIVGRNNGSVIGCKQFFV